MNARELRITHHGNARQFRVVGSTETIQCAFDLDKVCTPDCAACVYEKTLIHCIRPGVNDKFQIGFRDVNDDK